ncbi:MAG: preprotein translocase subunit SecE [Clostridia bacterium]|nr:preprotein translocase subunit SecE [Clostridia bacterium]
MSNNTSGKKAKVGFFQKIGNFFKNIGTYFKEVFSETKKLTWPSRKEVISYTLAVIGFVALMALFMWVLDLAFSNGVSALASIKIGG